MVITVAVKQKRRRLDAVERGPDVGAQVKVEDGLEVAGAAGQALAAGPPSALPGIADPTRSQFVRDGAGPDFVAERVDILGEGRLGHSARVVVCSEIARVWAEEHQRAHALRIGCGQEHGGSADSDIAKTDAHSVPTASSTATSPSVHACIAGRS